MQDSKISWCTDTSNPIQVAKPFNPSWWMVSYWLSKLRDMSTAEVVEHLLINDGLIPTEYGGFWCRKSKPECAKCYAEHQQLNSFFKGSGLPYTGDRPRLRLDFEELDRWGRMKRSRIHFVSSQTDIAGEWVPAHWFHWILDAMVAAPQQHFLILTKWPERACKLVNEWLVNNQLGIVPNNISFGCTAGCNATYHELVPWLLEIKCELKFISAEPLIGPLTNMFGLGSEPGQIRLVFLGGESGLKNNKKNQQSSPAKIARDCHLEWMRQAVSKIQAAGALPFVKQMGSNPMLTNRPFAVTGKGEDPSEWPEYLRIRKYPVIRDGRYLSNEEPLNLLGGVKKDVI